MSSKLAKLKEAYGTPTTTEPTNTGSYNNNYYHFWNMKVGEKAVVRFLPDANQDNPRGFLIEKVFHNLELNGQRRSVPCLSMYGEDCPICKISQEYYKAKDDINGKKYWKKKQYIAQVLIVEDPLPANEETGEKHTGQIRYITLSYQVYNIIKDAFSSDELEEAPYDYENGYDFIIKKTTQGDYASYTVGTKFANKQRALTEAELSVVYENSVDLSTLLPKNPGTSVVQAMLDAEMNGEEYADNYSNRSTNSTSEKPATTTSKASVPSAADNSDDEDTNQDVEDMLAKIRERRAAKKD